MEKETKSILTRAGIRKDILGEMRAGIFSVCSLVLMLMFFGSILTFIAFRPGVGRIICGASFVALILLFVIEYTKNYVMIARGHFLVVEDELLYSAEETVYHRRHAQIERVLYFADHGRYVISHTDGSAFDYSNEGDRFYLVIRDSKKPKKCSPFRVYNTRIYQWRE